MEKRHCLANRKVIITDFFDKDEHLYEDQLGWTTREKQEARSFISKEIFDFEIVRVGLNIAFYYVDNDTFYGIHTECIPIEVKVLPRNRSEPFIDWQCKGDTHEDGEVIYSFDNPEELWTGIKINGKTLEEVLERSYIITLN